MDVEVASESTAASLPPTPPLLQHCTDAWRKQGEVEHAPATQCAEIAFRFSCGLGLPTWHACRLALTAVRLLAVCHFDIGDIEVTFAHALVMLRGAQGQRFFRKMDTQEKLLVAMLHLYVAHSMVFDQFVHFTQWHEWLFSPFCSASTSGAALKKICALQKWSFVVPSDKLSLAIAELQGKHEVNGGKTFLDPKILS